MTNITYRVRSWDHSILPNGGPDPTDETDFTITDLTDVLRSEEVPDALANIAEYGHAFIGGGAAALYRIERAT